MSTDSSVLPCPRNTDRFSQRESASHENPDTEIEETARTVSSLVLVPVDDSECDGSRRLTIGRSMTVGRTDTADLRIPDDRWMSRSHFSIECTATHGIVKDLSSGNGTFVNGDRVFEAEVFDGDQITAGRTTFTVRFLI